MSAARDRRARVRTSRLLWSVGIAIGIVGSLAYWDAARASRAALDDLADEQVTLARGMAAALAVRTDGLSGLSLAAFPASWRPWNGRAL